MFSNNYLQFCNFMDNNIFLLRKYIIGTNIHGGYMFKKLLLTLSVSSILATSAFPCTMDGKEGIVPDNDMYIPANAKSILNANIDEAKFNEIIDKVFTVYEPIVADMGGELNVIRNWEDGTVNAYAHRQGGTWNVAMFGGLARHETITEDGFALVVCHEIGHHIGGAPKKRSIWSSWATNEGQADYFATLKCLRKVFKAEDNAKILAKQDIPETVISTCAAQFSSIEDQLICQRGAMAGLSTAKLFQALRSQSTEPAFDTPDTNIVSRTDHNHPQTQCRLDTYFSGAICSIIDTDDVDQDDESIGVCYRKNGDTIGNRPLCWFAPKED